MSSPLQPENIFFQNGKKVGTRRNLSFLTCVYVYVYVYVCMCFSLDHTHTHSLSLDLDLDLSLDLSPDLSRPLSLALASIESDKPLAAARWCRERSQTTQSHPGSENKTMKRQIGGGALQCHRQRKQQVKRHKSFRCTQQHHQKLPSFFSHTLCKFCKVHTTER